MKTVGTAELKAHLSEHLKAVREGQTITVLDRKEPIARIVPVEGAAGGLVIRPAKGSFHDVVLPTVQAGVEDIVDTLKIERRERF